MNGGNVWKLRYFTEEQYGSRSMILAEELDGMVFDFRFWIGQPQVVEERIVVKSGLLVSASSETRFCCTSLAESQTLNKIQSQQQTLSATQENVTSRQNPRSWWSAQGHLNGHPCKEPGIEWFLDEFSGTIQWGFAPNLWPQGTVKRLKTWGWDIHNPNVILRAIDSIPTSPEFSVGLRKDHEQGKETYSKNDENYLWNDLLEKLETVPLSNAPAVNGFPVTAEIPRIFGMSL